jgi:hypothetical protein
LSLKNFDVVKLDEVTYGYWMAISRTFKSTQAVSALQNISTCSLTHNVSSLEDDNVFVFCVAFF